MKNLFYLLAILFSVSACQKHPFPNKESKNCKILTLNNMYLKHEGYKLIEVESPDTVWKYDYNGNEIVERVFTSNDTLLRTYKIKNCKIVSAKNGEYELIFEYKDDRLVSVEGISVRGSTFTFISYSKGNIIDVRESYHTSTATGISDISGLSVYQTARPYFRTPLMLNGWFGKGSKNAISFLHGRGTPTIKLNPEADDEGLLKAISSNEFYNLQVQCE